jgi:hypothetical protein
MIQHRHGAARSCVSPSIFSTPSPSTSTPRTSTATTTVLDLDALDLGGALDALV